MEAGFLNPMDVRELEDEHEDLWMLLNPLAYYSVVMGRLVEVPVSFVTNFASFEPIKKKARRAAVVHDYLYSCSDVPREMADMVFREAIMSLGYTEAVAQTMFFAVAAFGASHKENKYTFYK
jgi:Protein of unknown function (DUF1353)